MIRSLEIITCTESDDQQTASTDLANCKLLCIKPDKAMADFCRRCSLQEDATVGQTRASLMLGMTWPVVLIHAL